MISLKKHALGRYMAYAVGLLLGIGLLGAYGAGAVSTVGAQAADSIYITPASGSYAAGSTFTVAVRENSSSAVNAVQADFSYGSNLQFVSIDASGSAFGIDASSTGGSGLVSMARGTTTPVSGDQLVARVTFKVLSTGTGALTMQNSSVVLSSTTNSNVANARNGASFALTGSAAPATPSTPSATPATPAAGNATRTVKNPARNSIAPQGTAQTAPLPGDGVVELEAPATIVTTPDAGRPVTKVEYLINDRVVSTDAEAPYTHSIDTAKYRNGTYMLTTKTYYQDGAVDVSSTSLVVKNRFDMNQLWLQVRHYAWLVVIVLIVIAELVYLKLFRKRRGGQNGPIVGGNPPAAGFGGGNQPMTGGPPTQPSAPINPSMGFAQPPVSAPPNAINNDGPTIIVPGQERR